MRAAIRILVLILTSAASAAGEAQGTIEFEETLIQSPFGETTFASAINDRNQIAGTFLETEFSLNTRRVFVFSAKEKFIAYRATLSNPELGESGDVAADINNRGTVVGSAEFEPGKVRAARWTSPHQVEDLGTAGAFNGVSDSQALGINERGHIVGATTSPQHRSVAFLWRRRFDMELLGTLGGPGSVATDINDRGTVVGESDLASGERRAFIWTRRRGMQDLGVLPGGTDFIAWAINNWGVVVGSYRRGDCLRPFVWTRHRGMQDLGGEKCGTALDINDWGVIAGTRIVPSSDDLVGPILHAALWDTQGNTLDLSPPRGADESSAAVTLNNRNISAGSAHVDPEGVGLAAKWTPIFR
jgi:probable HAF family extracellular repeat protein